MSRRTAITALLAGTALVGSTFTSTIGFRRLPDAIEPAFAAIAQAQTLGVAASPKEQALIQALDRRYSPDATADRNALDTAHAGAMADTAASFGDDDNVQALQPTR